MRGQSETLEYDSIECHIQKIGEKSHMSCTLCLAAPGTLQKLMSLTCYHLQEQLTV